MCVCVLAWKRWSPRKPHHTAGPDLPQTRWWEHPCSYHFLDTKLKTRALDQIWDKPKLWHQTSINHFLEKLGWGSMRTYQKQPFPEGWAEMRPGDENTKPDKAMLKQHERWDAWNISGIDSIVVLLSTNSIGALSNLVSIAPNGVRDSAEGTIVKPFPWQNQASMTCDLWVSFGRNGSPYSVQSVGWRIQVGRQRWSSQTLWTEHCR